MFCDTVTLLKLASDTLSDVHSRKKTKNSVCTAILYQYTVVDFLFKRLNSNPAFSNHPPDTSQEKLELLMINKFRQVSSSNFLISVAYGIVLWGRHLHSPEGLFMLIVARVYTGVLESDKNMAYISSSLGLHNFSEVILTLVSRTYKVCSPACLLKTLAGKLVKTLPSRRLRKGARKR